MTKDYYGTKRITAWHEERDGKPGYAVKDADGYIIWSPADVFEAAYQPVTGMSFGHALQALKEGHRVARTGWNGKAMFLFVVKGNVDGSLRGFAPGEHPAADHGSTQDGIRLGLFECGDSGTVVRLPCIAMKTASGAILHGWLASQTDMLADDWQIVEG